MTARETAALIVVVVSLLFFRVFRERCLLVWGAGWVAYGLSLASLVPAICTLRRKRNGGIAQADFVLAMGLFAAAALMSVEARRALTACGALVGADGLRGHAASVFSGSARNSRRWDWNACRLTAAAAVVELLRYRFGRIGLGLFSVRRRVADLESELASVHQSYPE